MECLMESSWLLLLRPPRGGLPFQVFTESFPDVLRGSSEKAIPVPRVFLSAMLARFGIWDANSSINPHPQKREGAMRTEPGLVSAGRSWRMANRGSVPCTHGAFSHHLGKNSGSSRGPTQSSGSAFPGLHGHRFSLQGAFVGAKRRRSYPRREGVGFGERAAGSLDFGDGSLQLFKRCFLPSPSFHAKGQGGQRGCIQSATSAATADSSRRTRGRIPECPIG
jgi:hypothetical protein